MRHGKDDRTLDIFDVPQPKLGTPGSCNYSADVSLMVGQVLKGHERHQVAAQMTDLSGDDVSTHMLNAWSSAARLDHNIPFYRVVLLESVCDSLLLTNWLVDQRGGRVAYGRDALDAELGRLKREAATANQKARNLERLLGVRT